MKVIARQGIKVPKEFAAREYVTDAEAIEVPDTVYYQRRLAEGDLIVQAVADDAKKSAKAATKEVKAGA
ncbi:DUF2635 domain-containing protein [Pandoraea apista]|uniref:DUF2635 domain-containing protein n=1 Tax=Pandoraea apista TaxID=93218 RepID=UPI000F661289|nr:DUF2635 domain-containing protein [Pandoraea apista]RRW90595.1 DUF2635 domain-containing protein [Pandoraea apista]RRX00387.1 DUF2635 domain-containing protein [Pandoraea apista]